MFFLNLPIFLCKSNSKNSKLILSHTYKMSKKVCQKEESSQKEVIFYLNVF